MIGSLTWNFDHVELVLLMSCTKAGYANSVRGTSTHTQRKAEIVLKYPTFFIFKTKFHDGIKRRFFETKQT